MDENNYPETHDETIQNIIRQTIDHRNNRAGLTEEQLEQERRIIANLIRTIGADETAVANEPWITPRMEAAPVNFNTLRALYFGDIVNPPAGPQHAYPAPINPVAETRYCYECDEVIPEGEYFCRHDQDGNIEEDYVPYHERCCPWHGAAAPDDDTPDDFTPVLIAYDEIRPVGPALDRNPTPAATPATFRNTADRILGFSPTVNGDPPTAQVADLTNRHVANSNIITSVANDGYHYPVLNFDFPVRVYPSTTPGHYHVYLDKPIESEVYFAFLDYLNEMGLTDRRWTRSAHHLGASWVRLPWVQHGDKVDPNAFLPFFEEEEMTPGLNNETNELLYDEVAILQQRVQTLEYELKNDDVELTAMGEEIARLRNQLAERRAVTTWS